MNLNGDGHGSEGESLRHVGSQHGTEGMPGADLVGGERLELPTSSV